MEIDYYLVSAARRAHRLRQGREYVIGREQGVDIHVQDAMISRRHAVIRFDDGDGQWLFVDLGSRNGSFINGEKVEGSRVLNDQDRVQVGGQVYQYHMVPPGSDVSMISSQAPQIQDDVTMGAGMSAGEIFTQGAAFTGEMTEGGLFELLQFCATTRKTGRLDMLRANMPMGSIGLVDGAVRDAVCRSATGMDGLLALLNQPTEKFAFHADAPLPSGSETVQGSAEGVLMELARMSDEGGR